MPCLSACALSRVWGPAAQRIRCFECEKPYPRPENTLHRLQPPTLLKTGLHHLPKVPLRVMPQGRALHRHHPCFAKQRTTKELDREEPISMPELPLSTVSDVQETNAKRKMQTTV